LLELVYEQCLCYELSQRGLGFQRQVELPVLYKGIKLNRGFRMDLVVEDAIILELKTVDELLPIHSAQLLTYLKLSGKKIGLLINFNEPVLKRGLKRLANRAPDAPGARPSAPSAPSAFSGFDFRNSLRLCVSAVNLLQRPSAPSAPSAFSGFGFRNSLRLCASAVNMLRRFLDLTTLVLKRGLKRLANRAPDAPPARPSAPSAPSAFSGLDFLNSQRLCVSAVNK
jgi:GxxExxY protein